MPDYAPPVDDMHFLLTHVLGLQDLHADLDAQTTQAILDEAAKLAREELAPLNQAGDRQGCQLHDGAVTTPDGFAQAYATYRDGGWNGLAFDTEYGGQGLPWTLAFAVQEMWQGANLAFGLCPLLNQGAVEALQAHGTKEQKDTYLPKLIHGDWTGTMNLTEPQAGSDLGKITARAWRDNDGNYRLQGNKIYITYGEHDWAENIIHLVLARLPDAPEGVKGVSMFLAPKFIPDTNGNAGRRNDVWCTGMEHKLGIHASPTCAMTYGGNNDGAIAYLVGEEHQGIKHMFTMMNNARLCVGLQGVALAERATQAAHAHAGERVQGRDAATGERDVTIDRHGDVRRMLMTMRALSRAGRGLCYSAARSLDHAHKGDAEAQARLDLLTPVVKAWCTEIAQEVSDLAIQVHGGMGFIEETGVAQFYRDARILPIYEGTNGIQAMDLVFRKVLKDDGAALNAFLDELSRIRQARVEMLAGHLPGIADWLADANGLLDRASRKLYAHAESNATKALETCSYPFLSLFGTVAGAFMLARSATIALEQDMPKSFRDDILSDLQFYCHVILPRARTYYPAIEAPPPL